MFVLSCTRKWCARLAVCLFGSVACMRVAAAATGVTDEPLRLVPDNLFHVKFVDESRAWITGYHGTVLRSDDGGNSWNYMPVESDQLIRRGAFPLRDTAWLVGHRGSIFHTRDAGKHWDVSHHESGIYLRDIAFFDENTGWAVGHEGVILHTSDGGQHWVRQSISDWTMRDLPRLSGITILDRQRIVIVGEFGVVAYTTDGGHSWAHERIDGGPSMTAISSSGETILAVGLDGAVAAIAYSPEGISASLLPLDIPTHLLDVRITPQGVLVSGFGVVVHCASLQSCAVQDTTDAFPSDYLWLGGVDLAPDGSVWAVGLGGHVGQSSSVATPMDMAFVLGGEAWQAQQSKELAQ
ncbi:MAG: WD40/YVTN/BNR-like repeat-containing protein [Oceanococcus sp.]